MRVTSYKLGVDQRYQFQKAWNAAGVNEGKTNQACSAGRKTLLHFEINHLVNVVLGAITILRHKQDIWDYRIWDISNFWKTFIVIENWIGTSDRLRHKRGIRNIPRSRYRYLPVVHAPRVLFAVYWNKPKCNQQKMIVLFKLVFFLITTGWKRVRWLNNPPSLYTT